MESHPLGFIPVAGFRHHGLSGFQQGLLTLNSNSSALCTARKELRFLISHFEQALLPLGLRDIGITPQGTFLHFAVGNLSILQQRLSFSKSSRALRRADVRLCHDLN